MEEVLRLVCPNCEEGFKIDIALVEEWIKESKIGKVGRVAHQLHVKSGPYYERWLFAMTMRGEPKRCGSCLYHHRDDLLLPTNYCTIKLKAINPGCYACKSHYYPKVV